MIDRKKYLEMCQACTVIVENKSADLPDCLLVKVDGIKYRPVGYYLGFDKQGNTVHKAVVKDLKADCTVICELEKVEAVEGENEVSKVNKQ